MTDQTITVRPNVQQVTVTPNTQRVTVQAGRQGPQGPQGPAGSTGPRGPAGPAGGSAASDAFAVIKRRLAAATRSTAVQILGDSTGNDPGEWVDLFANTLATRNPAWTVQTYTWRDDTVLYGAPASVRTGTAGALYQTCDGSSARGWPGKAITGTIDARFKIRADDYTPTASMMIGGRMTNSTQRSWAVAIDTTGRPQILYSTTGSNLATMSANATITATDGTDIWIRAVFTPDDGAGNRVLRVYQGTDGMTWTQIGTTVTTAGAVVLYNGDTTNAGYGFNIGGSQHGAYGFFTGRIYEVQICDGENGPNIVPALPDLWPATVGDPAIVGAPVLAVVNGSRPGGDIGYLGDPVRLPKMTPNYGQALAFLSDSHNEGKTIGTAFLDLYTAWSDAVTAQLPYVPQVILTQNPERTAASGYANHAERRGNLVDYAQVNRAAIVDTFQAFLDAGDWPNTLMLDDVHPNPAGSQLWANTVLAAYDA